ncbi:uncharacterized protein LOC107811745 [Nicotiana tabacum]|uniref:Uncharacterized protein LOC107811745 n=2 Tax=Nicotiana TaxID=4085 RepID=A0A1S4BTL8_TOBAC|nr:PREDICTED: uncharacterized protein LOC104247179 [Nicotiana sylvestris]XP_016492224.1 PREDICTED: uncharacterized protein LOC107811745 [Nicotiana tabacum]
MTTLLPSPEVSSFSAGIHPVRTSSYINPRNVQKLAVSRSGNRGARVRVCSSVKDLEESPPLKSGSNLGFCAQFSAPVETSTTLSTKVNEEEEEKRNYYLNTGYAIRTIREEFPALFYKELTFDIYRDDIVFKDPLNTFTGIENYKSIFWALRFHGRMFFRALWIDIVSVWQPVENMIIVRWTVHGIPRVPWESHGRFDGTSEYKLDKDGKIYEHWVHNIALSGPPKFHVLAVQELIEYIGGASTPKPTFFEIFSPTLRNIAPVTKFSRLRRNLGSILASLKRNEEEQSDQT